MADFKDIDLKCILGLPIQIENICSVYPLTINEIAEMGEGQYRQLLGVYSFDKSSCGDLSLRLGDSFDNYQVMCLICTQAEDFRNLIIKSLSLFLKEKIIFDNDDKIDSFFIMKDTKKILINSELFYQIKEIVDKQNFINEDKSEKKYLNSKAKEIADKLNKLRQEHATKDNFLLSDVISILANYSKNINYSNVKELTIFQLYTSYIRLFMWDKYHLNFTLLPYSSENDKLLEHHWSEKVNKNNK